MYLAAEICKIVKPEHEIKRRVRHSPILKQLDYRTSKLMVFNAVIASHKRCMDSRLWRQRTRLRPPSTPIPIERVPKGSQTTRCVHTKANSNEYMYKRASEILQAPPQRSGRKIRPLSERWQPESQQQVNFITAPAPRNNFLQSRWIAEVLDHANMELAWQRMNRQGRTLPNIPFDKDNPGICQHLIKGIAKRLFDEDRFV